MPQKYVCLSCGSRKVLDERPSSAPVTVRTGCDSEICGSIQTFQKLPLRDWERGIE